MTIDELIEELQSLKDCDVSGNTTVVTTDDDGFSVPVTGVAYWDSDATVDCEPCVEIVTE